MARGTTREEGAIEPMPDAWLGELVGADELEKLGSAARTTACNLGKEVIERKAGNLVRYALFSEYKQHVLRRDEVMKKGTLCD